MNRTAKIRRALDETRAHTLRLFAGVSDDDFCRQVHPDFSPVGWHLGHIGVTEAYWIVQQCQGKPSLSPAYDVCFTPADNPKANRIHLPNRTELLAYLHTSREQTLGFLECVDLNADHPLLWDANIFNMLLQHEEQHGETIVAILQMMKAQRYDTAPALVPVSSPQPLSGYLQRQPLLSPPLAQERRGEMVRIPAGAFRMGSDHVASTLDNERPQRHVFVADFLIDCYPISNAEFLQFMMNGGYRNRTWWSEEGWRWREHHGIEHPLYWRPQTDGTWLEVGFWPARQLALEQPVMCVSWYEADAYARSCGKRLPTEAEWEKAAARGLLALSGQVWEWTGTWFHPYSGFVAHPYEGYSVPYFDRRHRVLKGGSWATQRHVLRPSFRNWYVPWMREIFAGFRCVQ